MIDGIIRGSITAVAVWVLFAIFAVMWRWLSPPKNKRLRTRAIERSAAFAFMTGIVASTFPVSPMYGAFAPIVTVVGAVLMSFFAGQYWAEQDVRREHEHNLREDMVRRIEDLEHEVRWLRGRLEEREG